MSGILGTPGLPMTPALYDVFGLCLSLPFPAPLLSPAPAERDVDIHVTLGTTPQCLPQLFHAFHSELLDADLQIGQQGDMLWTTKRARFWASEGHTLVVEPLANLKPTLLRRFVLYVCLPALLNQRGFLAMHANSLVGPRGAIVITGRSGAGKSTLLAALMARGLPMLADDITVLQTAGTERPMALPGYPSYRLTADTLPQIKPIAEQMVAIGGERDKYMLVAPKDNLHKTPVPLHSLYLLQRHEEDHVQLRRVAGHHAFRLVQENCYHPAVSLRSPGAFQQINRVIQECAIYEISRPPTRWTLDEIADLVLTHAHESLG